MISGNLQRESVCSILAFVVVLSASVAGYSASQDEALAATYVPRLEKILKGNIASFWFTKSIDRVNGGYTINFGPNGESKGPGTKMIVTQARTLWLFSRLARAGYGGKENLDAADVGYRFLKEKMWDAKNGGFYWEVAATADKKQKAVRIPAEVITAFEVVPPDEDRT